MTVRDPIATMAGDHAPWLLRWFQSRLPKGVDAEDLVQEALLSLHRNRSDLRDPERVGAYLYAAARRIRDRAIRKERRRAQVEREAALIRTDSPADPRQELLAGALRRLPDDLSAAVAAYYSRDVTYEEAARRIGVSRATFQSRLRRALEQLRRNIQTETTAEGRVP